MKSKKGKIGGTETNIACFECRNCTGSEDGGVANIKREHRVKV